MKLVGVHLSSKSCNGNTITPPLWRPCENWTAYLFGCFLWECTREMLLTLVSLLLKLCSNPNVGCLLELRVLEDTLSVILTNLWSPLTFSDSMIESLGTWRLSSKRCPRTTHVDARNLRRSRISRLSGRRSWWNSFRRLAYKEKLNRIFCSLAGK